MVEMNNLNSPQLVEAVRVWTGWGLSITPSPDDARLARQFGDEAQPSCFLSSNHWRKTFIPPMHGSLPRICRRWEDWHPKSSSESIRRWPRKSWKRSRGVTPLTSNERYAQDAPFLICLLFLVSFYAGCCLLLRLASRTCSFVAMEGEKGSNLKHLTLAIALWGGMARPLRVGLKMPSIISAPGVTPPRLSFMTGTTVLDS